MLTTKRDMTMTKEDFLWKLYNNLGFSNLHIAHTYIKQGELQWSKWVLFASLLEIGTKYPIDRTSRTKHKTIIKATHRSILDIELLVDIDDCKLNGTVRFNTIEDKTYWCNKQMIKTFKRKPIVYSSGGKGYHLSLLCPELRSFSREARWRFKVDHLKRLGGELLKASDRVLISLEGEPHRKTGKLKREVKL